MTPAQREFVDQLVQPAPAPAKVDVPSAAQRAFIDSFLSLLGSPRIGAEADDSRRAFIDGFLTLARDALPAEEAPDEFERVIIAQWQPLVWRVEGAVAARFAGLSEDEHRLVRAFEDTPSLLAVVARERDEVTHARLLAWALRRPGTLGRSLRQSFLDLLGVTQSPEGWAVSRESTLGPESRVDVDIRLLGSWRCLVEVKIDAPERYGQLADYRRHLDAACQALCIDGNLVFLTLDGREGDTEAQHTAASFKDLLKRWLPHALGPGPDALLLRLWLVSIADTFYALGQPGPVAAWSFSRRVAMLDLLQDLEDPA